MRQEDLPKANATCVICGNKYYRCEKCIKLGSQGVHSWKLFCCASKCYLQYCTFESYKKGLLTKEQAKEELKNIDPVRPVYSESKYKVVFDEIMKPAIRKFRANILKAEEAVQENQEVDEIKPIEIETVEADTTTVVVEEKEDNAEE